MNYICTHKDFNIPVQGDFVIISNTPLKDKYQYPVIVADNELKGLKDSYCEGYMINDIWQKGNDDWVSINHYRRYIDYRPGVITLPIPNRVMLNNQYAKCHNINDLLQIEKIIDEYYPEYSMEYSKIKRLYPCNMFQLPRELFDEYCDFVFGVLNIFNIQNNITKDADVKKHVKNYDKQEYQKRLHGFLMERLGTIFFLKKIKLGYCDFKPIKMYK